MEKTKNSLLGAILDDLHESVERNFLRFVHFRLPPRTRRLSRASELQMNKTTLTDTGPLAFLLCLMFSVAFCRGDQGSESLESLRGGRPQARTIFMYIANPLKLSYIHSTCTKYFRVRRCFRPSDTNDKPHSTKTMDEPSDHNRNGAPTYSSQEVVHVAVGAQVRQPHPHRLVRDGAAPVGVEGVKLRPTERWRRVCGYAGVVVPCRLLPVGRSARSSSR